ncbi:MAG TPA: hypothetical protein PLJ34_08705, partial [Hyphomicrobiales bacterium]|nr:hypothetical protein [Hyphomicrobiales bacterium]
MDRPKPAAERAERSDLHGLDQVIEERAIDGAAKRARTLDQLLAARRSDPAGEALAATFHRREFEQVFEVGHHRVVLRDAEHAGMSQQ